MFFHADRRSTLIQARSTPAYWLLDVDDYQFTITGREEDEECPDVAAMGEFFWINKDGDILFADTVAEDPPNHYLVVEWFIEEDVAPELSLIFATPEPLLKVKLP